MRIIIIKKKVLEIPYDLTYMWDLKPTTTKNKLIDTEDRLVVARGGGRDGQNG